MKNVLGILLVVFASTNAFAGPKTRSIECTSQDNSAQVAVLTFLNGGNLLWDETWQSASSVGEANSSEGLRNIFELSDFYSDQDGGFQLVLKTDFVASGYNKGSVEVLFKGKKVDSYFCDNNL